MEIYSEVLQFDVKPFEILLDLTPNCTLSLRINAIDQAN
jgi:hypothetical protein